MFMLFVKQKVRFFKITLLKYLFTKPKNRAKLIKRSGMCKFYARVRVRIIRYDIKFQKNDTFF